MPASAAITAPRSAPFANSVWLNTLARVAAGRPRLRPIRTSAVPAASASSKAPRRNSTEAMGSARHHSATARGQRQQQAEADRPVLGVEEQPPLAGPEARREFRQQDAARQRRHQPERQLHHPVGVIEPRHARGPERRHLRADQHEKLHRAAGHERRKTGQQQAFQSRRPDRPAETHQPRRRADGERDDDKLNQPGEPRRRRQPGGFFRKRQGEPRSPAAGWRRSDRHSRRAARGSRP